MVISKNCIASVNIALHEAGRALKEKILQGFELNANASTPSTSGHSSTLSSTSDISNVRLICRGKVLVENEEIQKQGIRNGSVVMVLLGAGIEVSI